MSKEHENLGFTYRRQRSGEVEILHLARRASTLRGRDALEFLSEVESSSTSEVQQLMARITGNYKHGNEREASQHPRHRG